MARRRRRSLIVVEHKDRLTCFGFRYLDTLLKNQRRAIEVVNQAENGTEDLVADFTAIVYSFCGRLHGQRQRVTRERERAMAARTTYLERYLAGEHEPVWAELQALGAEVRAEPLYSDALAVAHETMRRVRHNIELVIPRLHALGYRFGEIPHAYGWEEWEREFTKAYPVFQPPPPATARVLDDLEKRVGVLPLSLRAFYLEIGGVNFVGTHPWADGGTYCDPLFMWPFAELPEEDVAEEDLEPGQEGATDLILSPDATTKYNNSGADSYMMTVPNASIDGVFDV
jgi:hypothetical protein